jgi:HPt (histidine-containing phosphotransfer) domain-containing protein
MYLSDFSSPYAAESSSAIKERRRFRAGDIAQHLDMVLVGELCLAVTVAGFQGLMNDFWSDASGQMERLLGALRVQSLSELPELAHSMKGSAAALGCVGLAHLLRAMEHNAAQYSHDECTQACTALLEHWQQTHALCSQAGFTSVASC